MQQNCLKTSRMLMLVCLTAGCVLFGSKKHHAALAQAVDGSCTGEQELDENGELMKQSGDQKAQCAGPTTVPSSCNTSQNSCSDTFKIYTNNATYGCLYPDSGVGTTGSSTGKHCVAQPPQECTRNINVVAGTPRNNTACSGGQCQGTAIGICYPCLAGTPQNDWSTVSSNECN
jgi:hypothetical protein